MTHDYTILSADELKKIDFGNATIIDVRTPMEHAGQSLARNHLHIPLDKIDPQNLEQFYHLRKDMNIYLLCRSGHRASLAAQKFIDAGYIHVFVIGGGILACEECGHELTADQNFKVISLERQVRIAAGAIAGIGALLAVLVAPLYALIPLFVGCGLVFAGITDRCGMALILAKAPWNQFQPTERTKL